MDGIDTIDITDNIDIMDTRIRQKITIIIRIKQF